VAKVPLFWPGVVVAAVAVGITAARGQQDLDAGKSGPQLFSQDCSACHRSPQGLAKSMSGGSLVSFLRQHYTSSASSANALAGYLQAAGGSSRAERPKGRAGEEQANQPVRDRAKLTRPGEPAAATPSTDSPAAQTPRKQREKLARPTDPATDHPAKSSRKSRRPGAAEPAEPAVTAPPAEPTPAATAVHPPAAVQPPSAVQPAAVQPSAVQPPAPAAAAVPPSAAAVPPSAPAVQPPAGAMQPSAAAEHAAAPAAADTGTARAKPASPAGFGEPLP
jgi:hypothetical protein